MSSAGFLNIVKPPGMTSHDVVGLVRRRLPRKTKVGHLGTLDPAAAGVLPLAVGHATKLIPILPNLGSRMKGYLGHLQLGVSTSTDDLEGEILTRAPVADVTAISTELIEQNLQKFLGDISQVPPQVSAVRQDGKRAYERVREGETVTLKARTVQVEQLSLLEHRPKDGLLRISLTCGSGTYVRSIARDLGLELKVGAALAFLLRTHSGPFHLEHAISLEEFLSGGWIQHLLPCDFPFQELPLLEISTELLQKGQRISGEFPTAGLLRTNKGLLRISPEQPGVAVVEAMFEEGRE